MEENNIVDKGTIVIVDDEEMVLTSLKSFLNLESQYKVKRQNTFVIAFKKLGCVMRLNIKCNW